MNRLFLVIAALLVVLTVARPPGRAQAFTLTVVNLNDSGPGSLRQAILDAELTPAPDTINFGVSSKVGLTGTINLLTPLPVITRPLTIVGPGPGLTVDAHQTGRTMEIGDGSTPVTASVSGLRLTGGSFFFGGGLYINPLATVTLDNMVFENNQTSAGGDGGGISNDGDLTLSNSVVRSNKASLGGGISNFFGTLTMTNTQVINNTLDGFGGPGAGIFNQQDATITNSTITGNNSTPSGGLDCCGGGIGNFNDPNSQMLSIQNSHIDGNTGSYGGGIANAGALLLEGGTINNNVAIGGGGGGVFTFSTFGTGSVTLLTGTTVSGNSTSGTPSGPGLLGGGGVWSCGSACAGGQNIVLLLDSTVANNKASFGGGAINDEGIMVVAESTLSGNSSSMAGGGIFNGGLGAIQSLLVVSASTVSGNSVSAGDGGGIYNYGLAAVNSSTFSGNKAPFAGARGGAAFECNTCPGGSLAGIVFESSTISANSASAGGGVFLSGSGLTGLQNSILANNPGGNCSSAFLSGGFNLSSDATCGLTEPGDQESKDAKLGPLTNNGGPTNTQAPQGSSPAIDMGPASCNPFDQRGAPRPTDGNGDGKAICDIGAVEVGPVSFPPKPLLSSDLFGAVASRSAPQIGAQVRAFVSAQKAGAEASVATMRARFASSGSLSSGAGDPAVTPPTSPPFTAPNLGSSVHKAHVPGTAPSQANPAVAPAGGTTPVTPATPVATSTPVPSPTAVVPSTGGVKGR